MSDRRNSHALYVSRKEPPKRHRLLTTNKEASIVDARPARNDNIFLNSLKERINPTKKRKKYRIVMVEMSLIIDQLQSLNTTFSNLRF